MEIIRFKKIRISFTSFSFLFILIFPQIAGATIYQPGETLAPDCAPGSANCGVAVFSLNGQASTTQTLVASSTGTDFGITSSGNVHTFNLPSASSTARGLLTAANWTTFNNKENAIIASTTSTYFRGDKTFQTLDTNVVLENGNLYFTNTRARNALFVVSSTPLIYNSSTGVLSINQADIGTSGYLSSVDWNTFNIKQSALGFTPLNLASNLSDLTSTSSARSNIGLGSLANALQLIAANNLSDLTSASSARTNLGLGTAAIQNLGAFLQVVNNFSDLTSTSTARTNLGLGTLATQSGTFSGISSGTNTGDQTTITGNAGTATALQTGRTINGTSFDGTANIIVTAAAGTLTGTTLNSTVVDSSLTSVGTIGSGVWNGTTIAVANGGTGTTNGSITGTGALSITSNATSTLTLDSGTTGSINIGTNSNAKNINIGGTGVNVISIGNTQTDGSVNIGAAMTSGTISIGGTGAQTGTITIDGGTGTQTINLGTGAGNKTVTLGSTNSTSTLNLNAGTGGVFLTGAGAVSSGHVPVCINNTTKKLFVGSSGNGCDPSSSQYKHDITDIGLGLDAVNALRPVGFTYNDTGKKSLGFIAEEVVLVDERPVMRDNNGVIQGIDPAQITPILTRAIQQLSVLTGDISPKVNADGSNNSLSTLIATIQSETAHDPVAIIAKKITDSKQFLTDFITARVTAIRGYFDEIFTKKIHTDQFCVKKSDGGEVCANGDQIQTLLNNANIISTTSVPIQSSTISAPAPSSSTSTGLSIPTASIIDVTPTSELTPASSIAPVETQQ